MFYSFPSICTCFITCFIALMLLAQPSWAKIRLMFVLKLFSIFMCFQPFFYVWIYMFMPLSCVWLLGRVQIQIQWSKFTSIHPGFDKGFGLVPLFIFMLCLPIFMCLCLDPCLFAQIQALCHVLASLCVFVLVKHMENTVLYLIQKHAAKYEQIYFIHVRQHVTSEFWKQRMRERTLMQ